MAKRLWAAIMDAAVFVFAYFILALWVFTPLANVCFKYNEKYNLGHQYRFASHLLLIQEQNESGDGYVIVEVKDSDGILENYIATPLYSYKSTDPSLYINRVYYYYHNYKTNQDIELPLKNKTKTFDPIEDHFVSPEYNQEIDGKLPKYLYTNEWFSDKILNVGKEDSYFKIDDSKEDYLESIVLIDESKKDDALTFLKEKVSEATKDFANSKYYQDLNNSIYAVQLFIFMPPFVLAYMTFYMLIPLLMKDGETLGKRVTHIAVISNDGYSVRKRQIVFRQILLFLAMFIAAFVVGIGITSIAIMCLLTVILFGITLLSKTKRSPHDYAAYTVVVDSIHSTWFKNKEDEERHQQELEANMAKYKRVDIKNENVIQIGSTIVDEKLKKEIEQERSASKKEKNQ